MLVVSSARTMLHSHLMHYYQFRKKGRQFVGSPTFSLGKKPLDAAAGIQIGSLSKRGIVHRKSLKEGKLVVGNCVRGMIKKKLREILALAASSKSGTRKAKSSGFLFFSFLFLLYSSSGL